MEKLGEVLSGGKEGMMLQQSVLRCVSGSDEFSVWNCTRLTVDAQWARMLLGPDTRETLVSLPLW